MPTAYGDTLTFWDWKQRKVTQTVKLGPDGLIPLELRFLHDPAQPHGFVGAALSSNVIHFTKVGSPHTPQPHPDVTTHAAHLLCKMLLLCGACICSCEGLHNRELGVDANDCIRGIQVVKLSAA